MAQESPDRIHALSIPTGVGTLLVPSATIAEVVNVDDIAPIPLSPPFVIGIVGWRTLGVPVVSFEALLGRPAGKPSVGSKAVVFYPLAGRTATEFFAVLSSAEPRPQTVDAGAVGLEASELPSSPYVAGGVRVNSHALWIPDFDSWKTAFYPP